MKNTTHFISDVAADHLMAKDGGWYPLLDAAANKDDLLCFDTKIEALAFCLGYEMRGGHCREFPQSQWRKKK